MLLDVINMQRSVFDLLNNKIDYEKEYDKLKKFMFENACVLRKLGFYYEETYESIFDELIMDWEYRGTFTSLGDMWKALEAELMWMNITEGLLYVCELILNIHEYFIYREDIPPFEPAVLNDKMYIENIHILLSSLGYKSHKEGNYRICLLKTDADSINTAQVVKSKELSELILNYNDFKIVNSVEDKKSILFELSQYLEPDRSKLKGINKSLDADISTALNNLHIRHNNLNGDNKKEYTSTLEEKEFINWYDKTYYLILLAFRLLELPDIQKEFTNLRTSLK